MSRANAIMNRIKGNYSKVNPVASAKINTKPDPTAKGSGYERASAQKKKSRGLWGIDPI